MPIVSITRDWGTSPAAVRITTTETLAQVVVANYMLSQESIISVINKGTWQWVIGDLVALTASDGDNIFRFDGDDFSTLIPLPGGGGGGGNANVIFPVVSGDFVVFDGTTGDLNDLGYAPSDASKTTVIMANGAVVSGNIPEFTDIAGTIGDSGVAVADLVTAADAVLKTPAGSQTITVGSLTVSAGNLVSGSSGNAGLLRSFPATGASGTLSLSAVTNVAGDFSTTISNTSNIAQTQVVSIPDVGSSSASFIMSNIKAFTLQSISGSLEIADGFLVIGKADDTGQGNSILSIVSQTALKGSLNLEMVDNLGNFDTIIRNAPMAQMSTIIIPDPGNANAQLLIAATNTPFINGNFPMNSGTAGNMVDSGLSVSSLSALASPIGKVVYVDMDVTAAGLAVAGKVYVVSPVAGQSFKIRSVMANSSSGLSGGGGNRSMSLQDNTGAYANFFSDFLQAPDNSLWNNADGVFFSPGESSNRTTDVGLGFWFKYFGGTTDFTTGSINVTVAYERIT